MTIDWDRVNATTEEDIARQAIEDESTEDDFDHSKGVRGSVRAVLVSATSLVELGKAEALLRQDYDARGLPEYKAAAEAVRALLADEVA